ncbi:FMN-dependent alpha-hydroxy acid dehydrogenase [Clavulina sp. PMI_390]|nr:FMN-dependent alpha-hydroxy acid dehydrogenase [Clavulina sp. PMI_390]
MDEGTSETPITILERNARGAEAQKRPLAELIKERERERPLIVKQLDKSLYQYNLARYTSQTPALFGTVNPDEIERLAGEKLNKDKDGAFGYVYGSAGLGTTNRANRNAFERWRIIPRMLVDAGKRWYFVGWFAVVQVTLFGPVGVQGMVHPEGEIASARAAAKCGVPWCLSTAGTRSIEAVVSEVPQGEKWFQFYWSNKDTTTISLLQRAKASGYTKLVVTLDTMILGWRPVDLERAYSPFVHGVGIQTGLSDPRFMANFDLKPDHTPPAFPYDQDGLNAAMRSDDNPKYGDAIRQQVFLSEEWLSEFENGGRFPVWEDLEVIRENWEGPIILKGIQAMEDAEMALEAGCEGIVVSNHGGRQVDGAIASLDALVDIMKSEKIRDAQAVGKFTVLFDSGIRTGPDVLKALALGAQGVLLGRLYMYGLALKGEAGVEAIIKQLLTDVSITMGLAGYNNIEAVREKLVKNLKYDPHFHG